MARPNIVEKEILGVIGEKPKSIRRIQSEINREWFSLYRMLRDKTNPRNLVRRGCVEEVRIVDKTLNVAQDMYAYKKGPNYEACLRGEI